MFVEVVHLHRQFLHKFWSSVCILAVCRPEVPGGDGCGGTSQTRRPRTRRLHREDADRGFEIRLVGHQWGSSKKAWTAVCRRRRAQGRPGLLVRCPGLPCRCARRRVPSRRAVLCPKKTRRETPAVLRRHSDSRCNADSVATEGTEISPISSDHQSPRNHTTTDSQPGYVQSRESPSMLLCAIPAASVTVNQPGRG